MNRTDRTGIAARLGSLLWGRGPGSLVFYGTIVIAVLPLAAIVYLGHGGEDVHLWLLLLLILLAAAFLAYFIVDSQHRFATWIGVVAEGELNEIAVPAGDGEWCRMQRDFLSIVRSLRDASEFCQAIAAGELDRETGAGSDRNILAPALNGMVANLRQIMAQADRIADGAKEAEIAVRSEADMLGKSLHHMTARLRQVTDEHKKSLGEAKKLIDNLNSLPAPIFTLDRDLRVTYVNPAGAALTRLSQSECIGAACHTLFPTPLCRTRQCPAERIMREGKAVAGENIIETEEFEMPVSFRATPLLDAAGAIEGTMIYYQDISQRLQVMEELQRANRDLREQTEKLLASEEALQVRQEELVLANRRLEERTETLEEQQSSVLRQNVELETARSGLERKTRDLEKASRYKTEFLANMSHELRTPLNSMLLLSKTLANNRDGNLTERQVEYARTIYQAGTGLLELINEILDLSRVEAGKILIRKSAIEIRGLANSLRQMFEELARGKDLSFSVSVEKELPEFFFGDRMRVEQILKNFLSNAFKFTEEGTVSLSFSRHGEAERIGAVKLRGEVLLMTVTDTGIGVPADKHEYIFEEFQQVDGTMTRKYGGTGLGLSISRKLADLLGGEIILLSEKGWGSSFSLALPFFDEEAVDAGLDEAQREFLPDGLDSSTSTENSPGIAEEGLAAFAGKKVLLVDEDMRTVFALTAIFERWGIHVLFAKKLGEALEIFNSVPGLDLALVDFAISDGEGGSALETLRAKSSETPVVAMVNEKKKSESAAAEESKEENDYLPKPCDPVRLKRFCTYWMAS